MPRGYSRTDRVGQLLQRELAGLLQKEVLKDPRLPKLLTISAVVVARDLENAKVYVTLLGDEVVTELSLEILNSASKFLRHLLGKRVKLRTVPNLLFVYDSSLEYGNRLSALINKVTSSDSSEE